MTVHFTPPTGGSGACCSDDGSCLELSPANCSAQGGSYQGNGTDCVPNVCPQPGACCLPDGVCADLLDSDCQTQGGTFQGVGTDCAATECIGACCGVAGASREGPIAGDGWLR